MGTEIERKFLVNIPAFMTAEPVLMVTSQMKLQQGYLSKDPCVRIRIAESEAWLTIKSKGLAERSEWEYLIPVHDAQEIYRLCQSKLVKIRRRVVYRGRVWDVDEFLGSLVGLWLAEIELKSLDESFPQPMWLGKEVTGDPSYSNSWLAERSLPP